MDYISKESLCNWVRATAEGRQPGVNLCKASGKHACIQVGTNCPWHIMKIEHIGLVDEFHVECEKKVPKDDFKHFWPK